MKAYLITATSGDRKEAAFAASQTEAAGVRKRLVAEVAVTTIRGTKEQRGS